MKFTKILVIFLALSMLLVSCNGVGNGAATSEPDETMGTSDSSLAQPETTLPPMDWTPPDPNSPDEYIRYGNEMISMTGKNVGGYHWVELTGWRQPKYTPDRMKAAYASDECFIIQFTATDYAVSYQEATFENGMLPRSFIEGTVDKIYLAGSDCAFSEGEKINLDVMYGGVIDEEGEIYILSVTVVAPVLRKGYSYILCGRYNAEKGVYEISYDSFELSSDEDQVAFWELIGREYQSEILPARQKFMPDVLEAFPPVEPTRLED